ncbi:MAG: beta-ketoacyl-ACP synthase II [Anaerolineales bacterium]
MHEKVVITGIGTINPLGNNVEDTWKNIVEGVSGVGPLTLFDATDYLIKIACEVKDFNPADYMPRKEARRRDRFGQLAMVAAGEAVAQSGLEITGENAGRVGVIVSAAIGGFRSMQDAAFTIKDSGPRRLSPYMIPKVMPNGAAGMIGIEYGAKGPAFSVASACASGADGIGMTWMMIRSGIIDAAIAGAADATIIPIGIGSFDRLGAMSRRANGVPQPFDRDRDGLVMGEGAAILILERENHARARGTEILAELAGYAATTDSYHVTAPATDGAGGAAAMRLSLETAGANPDEVGYISAHGTATKLNDLSETRAIKAAFGDLAYKIPISSTKSMTGHMMGTTGALEAILCVQAVRENTVPPTINYHTPDPECDLDYIPNEARDANVQVAISNAFGFGGHNAVLTIREYC